MGTQSFHVEGDGWKSQKVTRMRADVVRLRRGSSSGSVDSRQSQEIRKSDSTARERMRFFTALSVALLSTRALADLRSTVYAATIARSGSASNCSLFSSLFTPDGAYESPVGSGLVVGPTAIAAACEDWNALINQTCGNGWCECPTRDTERPLEVGDNGG